MDAKLIFRSAVGHQRSPFFLNVNPENFRIASISFFPARGVCVRATRALQPQDCMYTAGRRIVHSRMIIHRSPSLRFRPRIPWILQARSLLPREFCSFTSRQGRILSHSSPWPSSSFRSLEARGIERDEEGRVSFYGCTFPRNLPSRFRKTRVQLCFSARGFKVTYIHRVSSFPVVPLRCTSFVSPANITALRYFRQYGSYYLNADI